jgi:hypothetical protein
LSKDAYTFGRLSSVSGHIGGVLLSSQVLCKMLSNKKHIFLPVTQGLGGNGE